MGKKKKNKKKAGDWIEPQKSPMNNAFASLGGRRETDPSTAEVDEPKRDAGGPRPPARAVLRAERKGRGGKTVTLVTHLQLQEAELKAWSKALRKKMGCAGHVEGDCLVFAGDQRDRLTALLEARGVRRITRG